MFVFKVIIGLVEMALPWVPMPQGCHWYQQCLFWSCLKSNNYPQATPMDSLYKRKYMLTKRILLQKAVYVDKEAFSKAYANSVQSHNALESIHIWYFYLHFLKSFLTLLHIVIMYLAFSKEVGIKNMVDNLIIFSIKDSWNIFGAWTELMPHAF